MALEEYQRKRRFAETPEPPPKVEKKDRHRFVVQKHRATHLHFDFRLEMEGVLKSWAVPKGPSYDPSVKRLAMMTEDHPYDYASFEGVIPAGNYGAGNVIIWDEGTALIVRRSPDHLSLDLHGRKLNGRFGLTHTGGRRWLLVKATDAHARPGSDIVSESPQSVRSGRTWSELAEAVSD